MVTSDAVGRAIYHFFKAGGFDQELEVQPLSQFDPASPVERHTETRRVTRGLPDGSIEIIELITTDERNY
jgi:hypothetical protein